MTVALALSAHFTDLPKGVGESAPSAPSTAPTAFASFDGLLAEVSQELLAENPDLNASITKESQRFLPEKPTVVGEPTVVAADAVEHLTSSESTGSAGMVGDFTRQNEPVATLEQADSRPSETVFSPDTAALVELDDARHVFMASIQWTPPPRTSVQPAAAADAPKDDAREQISSAAPQFSLDPALTRVTESMYVPPVELSAQGVPSSADASGAATTIASDLSLIHI